MKVTFRVHQGGWTVEQAKARGLPLPVEYTGYTTGKTDRTGYMRVRVGKTTHSVHWTDVVALTSKSTPYF